MVFYKDWSYGAFYNGTKVFSKGYKSDKGARKKAFVEGRIIVEKAIEEKQMFVEHPIFFILVLDRFTRAKVKVFRTSISTVKH